MKTTHHFFSIICLFSCFFLINSCSEEESDSSPTTGSATFWVNSDFGCGPISVIVEGNTKSISGYNASTPDCGNSAAANYTLSIGSHHFTASCSGLTWSGDIVITGDQCSKMQLTSNGQSVGGTGQATFWTASDLGVGNIVVTCNGTTKTISSYISSGTPNCGASGCANFDLSPGTYPYTASGGSLTWSGSVTVTSNSCFKQKLLGTTGGTSGQATFWTASDLGVISVSCNGTTQTISSYYSSGAPSCGATGCANFNLNPGTYSYNASSGSLTWSGNVTVTNGNCSTKQLLGTSGGNTGQATFWTASNLGVISVTCNGITQNISSYYSSGAPSCGATGCANFNLSPGTYSYTANSNTLTWNGSVTVTSSGCATKQLTGSASGGNGNLLVWTNSDHGCGSISVTVSGYSGTISSYYSSGAPACGASGCANFTLPAGTYNVAASCQGLTWNTTATVSSGNCFKLRLN